MKKILLTITAAVMFLTANAQQLPNAGFETWTQSGNPITGYTYTPNGWSGLELSGMFISQNGISRSTEKHSGNYSLQVAASPFNSIIRSLLVAAGVPDSILAYPCPGIATNGTIDMLGLMVDFSSILTAFQAGGNLDLNTIISLANNITGGLNLTAKPYSISGYAKPTVANEGLCSVSVVVFSNDGSRHAIGAGTASFIASAADFQEFRADIAYFEPTATPSELIVLCSAASASAANAVSMLVDDLSVRYTPTAIHSANANSVSIFSAKSKTISINPADADKKYSISLYDISGKKIYTSENISGKTEINLPKLAAGIYFCKFAQGETKMTKKVIIK